MNEDRSSLQERLPRNSQRLEFVAVFVIFLGLTALYMGPAVTDCHSTIMGGPGDGTAGGVWTVWQYQKVGAGPWNSWLRETPYLNAPFGEPISRPTSVIAIGIFAPMWLLGKVTSSVCAWNLMVFLGFLVSGVVGYAFVRWLSGNIFAAGFAGFALSFSPFHMVKAGGHVSYVHSYLLVVLLWTLLTLWLRPTLWKGLVGGIALAGLAYTDGYYTLLGGVLVGCFLFAVATQALIGSTNESTGRPPRLLMLAISFVVALMLCLPIFFTFLGNREAIAESVTRPEGDLILYSARAHEYFTPPRTHPIFSSWLGSFQDERLHGSNYSEQTLYLGWTVLALAAGFFSALLVKKGIRRLAFKSGITVGSLAWILGVIGIGAIYFSAPPRFHVFALPLIGPSELIFDVVPFWRVYARFFLVVQLGFVSLAALGLALLIRKKPLYAQVGLALVLTVFLAWETLTFPPRAVWSFDEVAPVYTYLAEQKDVEFVAEYPLFFPGHHEILHYLTGQVVHRKKLFNSQFPGPSWDLRNAVYGPADPQTIPLLRQLGMDVLVIHSQHFVGADPSLLPKDLELVTRFGDTLVLRITEGPKLNVVAAPAQGFHGIELMDWSSWRWLSADGKMRLIPVGQQAGTRTVTFTAQSYAMPRDLEIIQSGKTLWRGQVSETAVRVTFEAQIGPDMDLRVDPGPTRGPESDTRFLSIAITGIDVAEPNDGA